LTSHKGAAAEKLIQPNAENHYNVTQADLPLSCPMPGMYLWNSHPKVYLPIESEKISKLVPRFRIMVSHADQKIWLLPTQDYLSRELIWRAAVGAANVKRNCRLKGFP
jgi:uncharacterized Zn-finger protein